MVLLAAKERRLLVPDDPLYTESYQVTALRESLETTASGLVLHCLALARRYSTARSSTSSRPARIPAIVG